MDIPESPEGSPVDTNPPEAFQGLVALASKLHLHTEGWDILYSESGGPDPAAVCTDRWLCWRDGAIRMQVRVISDPSGSGDWQPILESEMSAPLTLEQATLLVEHWGDLDRESSARARQKEEQERLRFEAFGPRR